MLVIRLTRTGRRNQPKFRLVLAEKSAPVKGKFIEILGHYSAISNPKQFVADTTRIEYWIGKGAKPSPSAASLCKKYLQMNNMEQYFTSPSKKRSKKKTDGTAVPSAVAATSS